MPKVELMRKRGGRRGKVFGLENEQNFPITQIGLGKLKSKELV